MGCLKASTGVQVVTLQAELRAAAPNSDLERRFREVRCWSHMSICGLCKLFLLSCTHV